MYDAHKLGFVRLQTHSSFTLLPFFRLSLQIIRTLAANSDGRIRYRFCRVIGKRRFAFGCSAVMMAATSDRSQQAWLSFVRGRRLSGSAFVMVMQTADFRRLHYFAVGNGLYSSYLRGVFSQ